MRVTMFMLWFTLGVMTLVFPYAGTRGSFVHSIASLQTVLWGLTPLGLYTVIQYFVKKRNWTLARSWKLFPVTLVCLSAIISSFVMLLKLNQGAEGAGKWNTSQVPYTTAETALNNFNINKTQTIMVNDPPGYTLATGRPSIMIPSGGLTSIKDVSDRYQTYYLLVGPDREDVTKQLKANMDVDLQFIKIFENNESTLYEIRH
jgi:hypothetical protein